MIAVIIAGGSGTRLWPLSMPNFPKHLLNINSDSKTLLQNTYERTKQISTDIYVITESSHAHHIREQLPELAKDHCIVEPARRGTASCIAAALAYISKNHSSAEPIAFIAADHYVRDKEGFGHSFRLAGEASELTGRIVLVGVEPDHPATGFGYIQKSELLDNEHLIFNVECFKEKPDFDTATKFLKSGEYLWNCSYFIGTIDAFVKNMQLHNKDLHKAFQDLQAASGAEEYKNVYLALENQAIDYALIEKIEDLLVVPAAFDWMDMGSYGDMHKAAQSDKDGNHVQGEGVVLEGVENCFVHNGEDKPLAVIGLDNIAVVNTKDGILVARKDLAQKVGEVSKRIKGTK